MVSEIRCFNLYWKNKTDLTATELKMLKVYRENTNPQFWEAYNWKAQKKKKKYYCKNMHYLRSENKHRNPLQCSQKIKDGLTVKDGVTVPVHSARF